MVTDVDTAAAAAIASAIVERIGAIPSFKDSRPPAAWYISDHELVTSAHEKWRADYDDWLPRMRAFAEERGFDSERVYQYGFGQTYIGGFYLKDDPDGEYTPWAGYPKLPVPPGWRKDKKGYCVPVRKTKADRASEEVRGFARIVKIPELAEYLPGMPSYAHAPGRMFFPGLHREEGKAVQVFWGTDPEGQPGERFTYDREYWERIPLSTFHLIQEQQS